MSDVTTQPQSANFDVSRAIDDGVITNIQKMAYILAALAIVMDGFDGQMIGYAIPAIIKEWGIARSAFSFAVATGLMGMAIGSLSAGILSDRFGRKPVLIASILLFGSATVTIGLAPDVTAIAIIRFFAGLGIGAALPAATTLTAEFIPLRTRTMAVITACVCYPLGGMLAGLAAGQILPVFGWRVFFFIGGSLPIMYAFLLMLSLKESPKYLARQSQLWEELRALLTRMTHDVAQVRQFTDGVIDNAKRGSIGDLFRHGRAFDTSWLWITFFVTQLSIYTAFSWLPTMLTTEGVSPALAGMGLTAYNLGGVIGAVLCAMAINQFGSRGPMVFWAAMSAVTAFALKAVDITGATETFLWGLGLHGLFVTALQCAMFTLCAHIYPTLIRTTGAASAMAFGRLGAFTSSFAGAAMISAGGASAYLNLLGGSMLVAVVSLALIRAHIGPKASADQAEI